MHAAHPLKGKKAKKRKGEKKVEPCFRVLSSCMDFSHI
jgi:hypothetical protein